MIKALIFDFYGVIRSDEYHDWLDRHGLKDEGRFKSLNSNTDKGNATMDQLFETLSNLSGMPAKAIRKEFKSQGSLNEQLLSLIVELKKEYKIALLSNASSPYLTETLREAGIVKLFDEILISSEIGLTKPSDEIFSYTLNQLNALPDEVVFIDDNKRFVEAAQKIGINGLVYTDYSSLVSDLKRMGIIDK